MNSQALTLPLSRFPGLMNRAANLRTFDWLKDLVPHPVLYISMDHYGNAALLDFRFSYASQEMPAPTLPPEAQPSGSSVGSSGAYVFDNQFLRRVAYSDLQDLVAASGLSQTLCQEVRVILREHPFETGTMHSDLRIILESSSVPETHRQEILRKLVKNRNTIEQECLWGGTEPRLGFASEGSAVKIYRADSPLAESPAVPLAVPASEPSQDSPSDFEQWLERLRRDEQRQKRSGIAARHPSLGRITLFPHFLDHLGTKIRVVLSSGEERIYLLRQLAAHLQLDYGAPEKAHRPRTKSVRTSAVTKKKRASVVFNARQAQILYIRRGQLNTADYAKMLEDFEPCQDPLAWEWIAALWNVWEGPGSDLERNRLEEQLRRFVLPEHPDQAQILMRHLGLKRTMDDRSLEAMTPLSENWSEIGPTEWVRRIREGVRRARIRTRRPFLYFDEIRDATRLNKPYWSYFLMVNEFEKGWTPLAFSVVRTRLTDADLQAAVWEARGTPKGIAWLETVCSMLNRTKKQIFSTIGTPDDDQYRGLSPMVYLYQRWSIIPASHWLDVVVGRHPAEVPSDLEVRLVSRFMRALAARVHKPLHKLEDRDFLKTFELDGHTFNLGNLLLLMGKQRGHQTTIQYLLKRYHLVDAAYPAELPAWDSVRCLEDFRPYWVSHAVKRIPWPELHPDLVRDIATAYAVQREKPGRLAAWISGQNEYTQIPLSVFPERPIPMGGFYLWAESLRQQAVAHHEISRNMTTSVFIVSQIMKEREPGEEVHKPESSLRSLEEFLRVVREGWRLRFLWSFLNPTVFWSAVDFFLTERPSLFSRKDPARELFLGIFPYQFVPGARRRSQHGDLGELYDAMKMAFAMEKKGVESFKEFVNRQRAAVRVAAPARPVAAAA